MKIHSSVTSYRRQRHHSFSLSSRFSQRGILLRIQHAVWSSRQRFQLEEFSQTHSHRRDLLNANLIRATSILRISRLWKRCSGEGLAVLLFYRDGLQGAFWAVFTAGMLGIVVEASRKPPFVLKLPHYCGPFLCLLAKGFICLRKD